MSKFRRFSLLFFTTLILFLAQSAFSENTYQVRHSIEFSKDQLSFDRFMGYDVVRLVEGSHLAEPGRPMLPSREIKIALPEGMRVTGIRVLNTETEEIPGKFDIFPAQVPKEIGLPEKDSDFVEPDMNIYSSELPYPLDVAEFIHQTDLAGQGMAVVLLYPLQYVPSQKRLLFHNDITLEILGVGGYRCGDYLSPNISERGRSTYEKMVEGLVQNPEDVRLCTAFKSGTSMLPPGGPFDHVIITSTSFASYFQPLVDWHTQKGVKDTVISTGWIYSSYSGSNDQEKIRSFVSDAYSVWGTSYFLLGGEHSTVPFEYRLYYSQESPGDQYYADFDDDWAHEAFVGRATVANSTEINTFIDKVLKYEKDPPRTNYALDALLIGMDYDADTHVEFLKGHVNYYLPSRFNVTRVYDSYDGNHRTDVLNALNAGQNLVNHADHSYIEYMGTGDRNHGWGIVSSDVDDLNNDGQLSVIVTPGCHPNHMDYNDCIAEHFVIHNPNQGAVAFNGNARSGWYYSGDPYSLSNALDREWWISLLERNKYNLGQTIADAKNYFPSGSPGEKQCEWTFNLLGEPEMPLWTDNPDSFDVTHPDTLPPGTSSFTVHVEDAVYHFTVYLAYVCLWKAGDVYEAGYTNTSGEITFTPSPCSAGSVYVTVTKRDYLPYQRQVEIRGLLRGDANGDGMVGAADVIYLINYLYRGGSAPDPLEAGDANCDTAVEGADVIFLINFLFREGTPPGCL
jgi:hypothetical protein